MSVTGSWKLNQGIEVADAAVRYSLDQVAAPLSHFQYSIDRTHPAVIKYELEYWRDGNLFMPYEGNLGRIILRKVADDATNLNITDSPWREASEENIMSGSYWSGNNLFHRPVRNAGQIDDTRKWIMDNISHMMTTRDSIINTLLGELKNDGFFAEEVAKKQTKSITSEIHFVDPTRIEQLRNISSKFFDLEKLIRLCDELNVCFSNQCYLATAMLIRAILDHVPPIFEKATFGEVANNYGGQSFKHSMQNLENSSRRIADAYLHTQIRRKESLPNRTQVNFSTDLDVLLQEIVRILK